ncbi:hypothetical protein H4R33_003837 [Dimargaris cristalligena]|uniref:Elongator complex protein 5 n=1 Tax=Dimargaris cristalligena TaxID=215637 RepID=A0A4P9ZXH6_9FUNG|nr:hypothetical protein H4R33_003837 [Dimargaris cristalligena]RKP38405.1 Elongator complex protein 5 [Dimargaris cristalligena]|eukprot:RKP38405.1 Elongator complex protein 5 [Dimargaris cristalligena]
MSPLEVKKTTHSSLADVLEFRQTRTFVPIYDSVRQSGLPLLRYAIRRRLSTNTATGPPVVLLVCLETRPDALVNPSLVHGGEVHAIMGIMGGSDQPGEASSALMKACAHMKQLQLVNMSPDLAQLKHVITKTVKTLQEEHSTIYVYYDSLVPFLRQPMGQLLRFFRTLGTGDESAKSASGLAISMALIHEDLLVPDATSSAGIPPVRHALEALGPVTVHLYDLEDYNRTMDPLLWTEEDSRPAFAHLDTSNNSPGSRVAKVEYLKKSRKMQIETSVYDIVDDRLVTSEFVLARYQADAGKPAEKEIIQTPENDPLKSLSFNLTLTDQQREAKNNLVLPYVNEQSASGAIIYQPDDGDDFDEEDPDDDLDI